MPDCIESGCIPGHFGSNVVDAGKPVPVEVIGWLHQNAEFIGNYTVFNPYQPNLADASAFAVSGFKINGGKSVHIRFYKLLVCQPPYIPHFVTNQGY